MIASLLPMLIEAASRAIVVALTVWLGMRLLRVDNVLAQKAAWCLVLAAALLMPLLMHGQWLRPYTTIELPAPAAFPFEPRPADAAKAVSAPDATMAAAPPAAVSGSAVRSHALGDRPMASGTMTDFLRPAALASFLYLAVSIALLARLFLGLGAAARLWLRARPVSLPRQFDLAAGLRLRSSPRVASPVTIGSGVVLPADYTQWNEAKLRIALAHERCHVRQGDFYLQILAGLYAALFWFSPLGWWLKRRLSDLGEAISDRAGLAEAASRFEYAQVLLEFAALPRPAVTGVAIARRSNLAHRIERLLNEFRFRHAFAGNRRRALLAVLVVPVALFAATALVGVEAAEPIADVPVPPAAAVAASPAAAQALGSEATFERMLAVNGKVELSVATGSGNIHLTRGSGSQIHVSGHVKARPGGSEERVHEIAANPPIEQTGNLVRIGKRDEDLDNISIDYEIEAPADAHLDAGTGSGNITDEGVGENAKLLAGSGTINATGLHGGFNANTGSGDIDVEQIGRGDAKAHTGSGTVELKGIQGALRASTGSGSIKVSGKPASSWTIETGSGNVGIWVGDAPLSLNASTGSGAIHIDQGMLTQGTSDHHHLSGTLNGGGPTVRIKTGSGDIALH